MEPKLSEWLSDLAHGLSVGFIKNGPTLQNSVRHRAEEAEKLEAAAEILPQIDKAIAERKEKLKDNVDEFPIVARIVEVLEYVRQ